MQLSHALTAKLFTQTCIIRTTLRRYVVDQAGFGG